MPTNYTGLSPTDPNYVSSTWLAAQPQAVRNAFSGNFTPGNAGIVGTLTSPIHAVNQGIGAIGGHPGGLATGVAQWGARNPAYWKRLNQMMALFTGAYAVPSAMGAYGGGAAVAGSAGAGPTSASTVDPFLAGGGSQAWAPIAGGATGASAGVPTGATTAGGFYGPAGNWTAGTATGDFGAVAGSTPWYNSYWGQTGINTGLNLLGGALQNQATAKAQKANEKAIEDRIRQALAALAPEHIMALAQQFLPQMAANSATAGQTAIQAVREQAARTGQLEGPRALSFEAGTRARLASDVQQRAFEGAMNTAGAQASAITGAPYTPIQPQAGIANAVINSANQAYGARFYQQANRQNNMPGVPYRYPGMGTYGNQGSYGWGF